MTRSRIRPLHVFNWNLTLVYYKFNTSLVRASLDHHVLNTCLSRAQLNRAELVTCSGRADVSALRLDIKITSPSASPQFTSPVLNTQQQFTSTDGMAPTRRGRSRRGTLGVRQLLPRRSPRKRPQEQAGEEEASEQ